ARSGRRALTHGFSSCGSSTHSFHTGSGRLRRALGPPRLLGLLLRALLGHRLLALTGDDAPLTQLVLHLLVVLELPLLLEGVDGTARLAPTLVHGLLRRGPGRRHAADDVELLPHRPQVRREPVDEHTDREEDT